MSLFNNSMGPADLAAVMGNNNDGLGGNNGWWIILLLLCFGNGWGNNMGGNGVNGLPYFFNNADSNMQRGFDTAAITGQLSGINSAISNGFSAAEIAACGRAADSMQNSFANQMATMQGFNALQAQLAQCCCDNRLATANLGSDIAREACAGRTLDTQNTQAILNAINGGIQSIKDQMCNDKIDAKNEKINELQNELNISKQNLLISNGFANEVDQLYNRLNNCPVPSTPVYGRTPIFTNNGCNCNCMGN